MPSVETAIDSQGLRVEIAAGVSVNIAESKSGVAKQADKQAIWSQADQPAKNAQIKHCSFEALAAAGFGCHGGGSGTGRLFFFCDLAC